MKTSRPRQPKSKHTSNSKQAPSSPCDILLEQAQICCHQAREAARLSRRQAAQGLLCTARELLHRAAIRRHSVEPSAALILKHKAQEWPSCSSSAGNQGMPLDFCLPLRLHTWHGEDSAPARDEALLRALESLTGTRWRWVGDILAVEKDAPYRVVVLRGAALETWRAWCGSSATHECELQVEVFAPMLHI